MKHLLALAASIGAVAACASLPNTGDGVVALQVTTPDSLFLFVGQSLQLSATALDLAGNPVAAPVTWATADTGLITVDPVSGLVTSKADTSSFARVQASTGTLLSDPISITLRKDTTTSVRAP